MSTVITSTSNERIKALRKLSRKRQRDGDGQIWIEGVRLVGDALAAGVQPITLAYAPEQIAHNSAAAALVERAIAAGAEPVACAPHVFATLSDTVSPQGIGLALAAPTLPLPTRVDLVLLLDRVREPGNAGTLLRTAEAAGVSLALFAPHTVDPFNDKCLRAAMGAHFRLPLRSCQSWDEVQQQLGDLPLYVAEANAADAYDEVDWRQPSALIVGGEAAGASAEARRTAQPIAIPMCGGSESLNAAVAGAVILFEAARQRRR